MKLTSHLPDDRRAHVEGRLRDIIRVEGTAEHVPGFPPADQVPQYVVKYAERIAANFGTAARFAALFPEALVITPGRLHA